jgi:hypothetical protein
MGEAESRKKHATQALITGLQKALRCTVVISGYNDPPARGADFALTWGHKHRCCAIARACALPLLVVERPFFGDRNNTYSLTWNWAHRLGIRPPADNSSRPKPELAPWIEKEHGRVVVFDQVPTDIMFQDVAGTQWAQRIADRARIFWRRESYVRPHPQVERTVPLEQDLESAWMGITYTSTSAVACVAAGVPCIAVNPKSMAYDVCSSSMEFRVAPNREEWAHWISYCQWSGAELEDGSALTHLLKAYDDAKEIAKEEINRKEQSGLD